MTTEDFWHNCTSDELAEIYSLVDSFPISLEVGTKFYKEANKNMDLARSNLEKHIALGR